MGTCDPLSFKGIPYNWRDVKFIYLECCRCDTGKYFIVTSLHDSISALERRVGAHFGDFFSAECMQSSDSRNLHCM